MLPDTVNTLAVSEQARRRAARIWAERRRFELEAAQRFAWMAGELRTLGASARVSEQAEMAADDELRHADSCARLTEHFGRAAADATPQPLRRVAPRGLDRKDALHYEIVALSCVTETLSTALLGALLECATDSLAKRTMHSILRDEVRHSRLGWAYLTEVSSQRAMDAVSAHLPAMLQATLSSELFDETPVDPVQAELAGLGQLERRERLRVVRETLECVVFPGLARYGADVSPGKHWLERAALRP
jgi:hypothetical protein